MLLVIFKYAESRVCTLCYSVLNMNKTWAGVEDGYGASNWFQGHYTKPNCMGLLEILPSSRPNYNLSSRSSLRPNCSQQRSSPIGHLPWLDSRQSVGEIVKNKTEYFWSSGNLYSGEKCETNKITKEPINQKENWHYWCSFFLSLPPNFPWHSPLHTEGIFLPTLVTLP